MRLLVDMDGVVVDYLSAALGCINEVCNTTYTPKDVQSYDLRKLLPDKIKDDFQYLLSNWIRFDELDPIPGSIETLEKLREAGHEIVLVSAAERDSHTEKLTWVGQNLPWLTDHDVIFTHQKSLIRGDVLLDDHPRHLMQFHATGGTAVCFDQPYNQSYRGIRAEGWPAFMHYIDRKQFAMGLF